MTRCLPIVIAGAVLCTGCISTSLKRHTLNQVRSIEDYRTRAVLDCLADMADNPNTLPSYGLLANGVTRVQDTGSASALTLWARALEGFSTETLALTASRVPQGQWTVDPVATYSQIDALRCACRWAIFGPQGACADCADILEDPTAFYSPQEPRFGVADRLRRLPPGWVKTGTHAQLPSAAAYKAHSGKTWVWVMPEYRWCFSEFLLVCHDIATIDPDQAVLSPPVLVTITRSVQIPLSCEEEMAASEIPPNDTAAKQYYVDLKKSRLLTYVETRAVKPEFKGRIEQAVREAARHGGPVPINEREWLAFTYRYSGTRTSVKPGAPVPVPAGESITAQQLNRAAPSLRGYLMPPAGIRMSPPPPQENGDGNLPSPSPGPPIE